MSNSSMDWAYLDSANEVVVGATVPLARLVSVPDLAPAPGPGPAAEFGPVAGTLAGQATGSQSGQEAGSGPGQEAGSGPGPASWLRARRSMTPRGRHHRTTSAAATAVAAAAACALAVPAASASAAPVPAAAASWKIVKTTHLSDAPSFTAVTATSPGNAWAFEGLQAGTSRPIAWHLSGSTWTREPFPGKADETVWAAGSSSATDVWAVTSTGTRSRALRWNGSSWKVAGSFHSNDTAVTVLSANDVWVFGSAGAWHYNGHSWSRPASGHGLISGSARSQDSVWAVGGTSVGHWNGSTWSRTSVASLLPHYHLSEPRLVGIYARSWNSVWALGTGGRQDELGPTVLLHYNGHNWARVALDASSGDPEQVIPDGSGGLWIPSQKSGGAFQMLRYSGGHLNVVAVPGGGLRLNVFAVAAIPHTASAFAAGDKHRYRNAGLGIAGAILEYKR
jgi:hypothetical protein